MVSVEFHNEIDYHFPVGTCSTYPLVSLHRTTSEESVDTQAATTGILLDITGELRAQMLHKGKNNTTNTAYQAAFFQGICKPRQLLQIVYSEEQPSFSRRTPVMSERDSECHLSERIQLRLRNIRLCNFFK
ncbi:hypothetical protein RvY_09574 [Ramazzottius varieornatus]|uniref:Uncharacterized protein n=1 Tax=Ramazzottius varieornatus TaxID=947166 RepID=A0A1D1VEC7_RAMVA|nr:hypothetical protein RvY_09574 [Ramazzottius varieornatus]